MRWADFVEAVDIRRLVARLDTRNTADEDSAWAALRPLGEAVVPFLLEFFPDCKTWLGRTSLVYHAIRYARTSDAAFSLGLRALSDRSFMVRYRGCAVLAYSLRPDALPPLRNLLTHRDERTVRHAAAAIDAIEGRNHHLFVDRDHSGRSRWVVNDDDRDT